MKHCLSCNTTKEYSEFYTSSSNTTGYHSECKECSRARKKAWAAANKVKAANYDKHWQQNNKDKKSRNYRNWQLNNRATVNSYNSFVRAQRIQRTPAWADKDRIQAYYDVCSFFNEVNGYIKYHVDHVIPLQGKKVSGLHVHNNLQIIPAKDNLEKSNKYG